MEKHEITFDDYGFSCMAVEIDGKLWFEAHKVATSLGYKKPDQAIHKNVPPVAQKQLNNTLLISEGGLFRLLCKSSKPEGDRFEKWVF